MASFSLRVLALVSAAALAGCASSGPAATAPASEQAPASAAPASQSDLEALYWQRQRAARADFTPADVTFMTGMIGHHAQALIMSRLAPTHGASPAVQRLAARIINAQTDEIESMQRWLRVRDQPVPTVRVDGLALVMGVEGDDMDHGQMDHSAMDHSATPPAETASGTAPTSGAGHGGMDHGQMNHGGMDHGQAETARPAAPASGAGHEGMDHGGMAGMDHFMMPGMLTQAQLEELDAARGAAFDRLFLRYMVQHHGGAITMVDALFSANGAASDTDSFKLASDIHVDQETEIARMDLMLREITE